jgi:hypothetical protein
VIAVSTRDDNGVESLQVNAKLPDIVLQDASVIAGVEEDALAIVLDECGVSPIFHELGGVAGCVVEHGDATRRLGAHGSMRRAAGRAKEKDVLARKKTKAVSRRVVPEETVKASEDACGYDL